MGYPLIRFLTASALLHAAVFFIVTHERSNYESPGRSLTIQLLPDSTSVPQRNHTAHPATAPGNTFSIQNSLSSNWSIRTGPVRTTVSAIRSSGPETLNTSNPAPTAAMEMVTRPAQPKAEATGQRLSRQVMQALLPYFHYPLYARQQGWQGEVHVAVHIARDGYLSNLRLARTSGHPVLDAAALNSLAMIRHLPNAMTTLDETSGFDLNVPVVYRLTEG